MSEKATYYTTDKIACSLQFADCALHLQIDLDAEDALNKEFGRYESIVLTGGGESHEFTPRQFMDGMRRMADRTATRRVTTTGAVGRCNCSACNWLIDPYDRYCRRCGAMLVDTRYERGEGDS